MKKYAMIFAALFAAVMISSCAKEQIAQPADEPADEPITETGLVPMTFIASAEDAASKAVLNADGKTVEWEGTESVAVFDGIKSSANIFTANSAGGTTSFTGTVSDGATSFTAVYPASAAVSLGEGDKPISAIIPNVQEATLNSFDPDAALYVASSTDLEAKFSFKAAFALLKVNVDVDNVISVTVENTKNNFAGSVSVNTTGGVSNGTGTTYKTVTLKKSDNSVLAKGVYYIVVRHLGSSSVYQNFKLSYITSKAVFGERSATNDIDNGSLPRKGILNIGSLSSVPSEQSWYKYYQAGYNVNVGSKTINRATNGDATLWTADNAVYAMTKTPLEAGGVIFLKAVGTGTFSQANNPTITKSTYLLADGASPVQVDMTNILNLAEGALYMKGIKLTISGKTAFFNVNKNTSSSMTEFIVDGCQIIQNVASFISTNSSFKTYGVRRIELVNNRFFVSTDANIVNVTSSYAGANQYKEYVFKNNYVFGTTDATLTTSIFSYTGTAADAELDNLVINNNLFYNAANAGIMKFNKVVATEAKNNIIWVKDGTAFGTSNAKLFGLKAAPSGTVAVTDNAAYGTLSAGSWVIADSAIRVSMSALTVLDTNPIALADVSTGVFTMASGYESYGPQDL